jgi:hypothetical protein
MAVDLGGNFSGEAAAFFCHIYMKASLLHQHHLAPFYYYTYYLYCLWYAFASSRSMRGMVVMVMVVELVIVVGGWW